MFSRLNTIPNYSEVLYIFTYQRPIILSNSTIDISLVYQSSDGSHHCAGHDVINKHLIMPGKTHWLTLNNDKINPSQLNNRIRTLDLFTHI